MSEPAEETSDRAADRPGARADSPLALRILGVIAAAILGIGTFSVLGVAVMQTLYDRGLVGHKGFEEMEALGYLAAGLIGGAVIGIAAAVWVGLRVWQSRWALLPVLAGVSVVSGVAIAVAAR